MTTVGVVVVRGVAVNTREDAMVKSAAKLTTPALELLRKELTVACTTPNGRLVVSVPPQEGLKTSLARDLCVSLLKQNPNHHIMYITYSESVARMQGRYVRSIFRTPSHHMNDDWRITGHVGGMMAEGVWSGLLGGFHSVVVVDDPLRYVATAREAAKEREDLHSWWSTFIATRLAPGASVVAVQSRTHRDDLAGRLIAQGWLSLNIPALADGVAPDALQRPVGTWLESLHGRTEREWKDLRLEVGEPIFTTMWQGNPSVTGD